VFDEEKPGRKVRDLEGLVDHVQVDHVQMVNKKYGSEGNERPRRKRTGYLLQGSSFKSRSKLRGMKPTGGNQFCVFLIGGW